MAIEDLSIQKYQEPYDFHKYRPAYMPKLEYTFSHPAYDQESKDCLKVRVRGIRCDQFDFGLIVASWLGEIVEDCDEDLIFYTS